jgi:hypothetical protein
MENVGAQPIVPAVSGESGEPVAFRFRTLLGGLVLRATLYALLCAAVALLVASIVL